MALTVNVLLSPNPGTGAENEFAATGGDGGGADGGGGGGDAADSGADAGGDAGGSAGDGGAGGDDGAGGADAGGAVGNGVDADASGAPAVERDFTGGGTNFWEQGGHRMEDNDEPVHSIHPCLTLRLVP